MDYNLAKNPGTPPEVLGKMVTPDTTGSLRVALASHPKLPKECFKALVEDPMVSVRLAMLSRGDLPLELLEILATDPNVIIRERMLAVTKELGDPYLAGLLGAQA